MIDFKKLADKLDKALAEETKESLTSWLEDQRKMCSITNIYGKGSTEELSAQLLQSYQKQTFDSTNSNDSELDVTPSTEYQMAA